MTQTIKFTGYSLQAIMIGGPDDPIVMGGIDNSILMGGSNDPVARKAVAMPRQYIANPGEMRMKPQTARAQQRSDQLMTYTFKGTFQDKFQLEKIRLGRKTYNFTMDINAED